MWDHPGPGLKPVSAALAGGFLTTPPPGKPKNCLTLEKYFVLVDIYLSVDLADLEQINNDLKQT